MVNKSVKPLRRFKTIKLSTVQQKLNRDYGVHNIVVHSNLQFFMLIKISIFHVSCYKIKVSRM